MPVFTDKSTKFVIRLALYGCKFRPFYHIVVTPNRRPRNFKPTDQLGSYDPMPNMFNERIISLNYDKMIYYMHQGAVFSKPVAKLAGLAGFLPVYPSMYVDGRRVRLKEIDRKKKSKLARKRDVTLDNTEESKQRAVL